MARRTDEDTDEVVDPVALLARLTAAFERMAEAPRGAGSEELMARIAQSMDRLSESQLAGAKLIADETKRSFRPSNEVVHKRSVFNRRGEGLPDYTKPKLKCIMLLPWLLEAESMTREEVELANLLETGTYRVRRIDGTMIKVGCQIDYAIDEVTPSRLVVTHETGFNNDYFKLMPPLDQYLRQMLKQHPPQIAAAAAGVMTDDEEEALIMAGQLSVAS